MPPPAYEMAILDARHEVHLSGAPRYSWEDPVRRGGRNGRRMEVRDVVLSSDGFKRLD
jgi:hypothetical protein